MLKLNRSKISQRASIQSGTKAYARHTDGLWYEVKVVMVTEGNRKKLYYGVLYPFSTHIYQVTRDRIMTVVEYERSKMVKENEPQDENINNNHNIHLSDEEPIFWSSWDDTGYFEGGYTSNEENNQQQQPPLLKGADHSPNREEGIAKNQIELPPEEPLKEIPPTPKEDPPPKEVQILPQEVSQKEEKLPLNESLLILKESDSNNNNNTNPNTPIGTRKQIAAIWLSSKPKSFYNLGTNGSQNQSSLNNSSDIPNTEKNTLPPSSQPQLEELNDPLNNNNNKNSKVIPSLPDSTANITQKALQNIQDQIELIREKQLYNQQQQNELSQKQQKLMKEQLLLFQQQLELQQKFQSLINQFPINLSQQPPPPPPMISSSSNPSPTRFATTSKLPNYPQ